VIGGSATFFSASASHLSPVQLVGVVGDDYPMAQLEPLKKRGSTWRGWSRPRVNLSVGADAIATTSTRRRRSRHDSASFRISAEDSAAVQERALRLPGEHRSRLQLDVLRQVNKPKLVACDTMNFWIESRRPDIVELIKHVDLIHAERWRSATADRLRQSREGSAPGSCSVGRAW